MNLGVNIKVLKLNKCKIGSEFTLTQGLHKHYPNLQALHLNENRIDAIRIRCTRLSELYLSHNQIGYNVEVLSSSLECCINLERLDLSYNLITEDGAMELASNFHKCTKLMWLNLSCNEITDEPAREIVSSINQCAFFRELNLSHNRITDTDALKQELTWSEIVQLITT